MHSTRLYILLSTTFHSFGLLELTIYINRLILRRSIWLLKYRLQPKIPLVLLLPCWLFNSTPLSVIPIYILSKKYISCLIIITALLSVSGLDFITAISGAATSISNVGPGLGGMIGPNGNFSLLPDFSKWVLTAGMILGRLELFAIIVLFIPSFWRRY